LQTSLYMANLLILKMGQTFAEIVAQWGDFDDWILDCAPEFVRKKAILCVPGDPLPALGSFSAMIISGSHSMVTHPNAWEQKVMRWLPAALNTEQPTLGICYGHQLLARVLGGVVDDNPHKPEMGYQPIQFQGDYQADPLFRCYPSTIEAFTFHYQTVCTLPTSAKAYANSTREGRHAVHFKDQIWGVQYHPEFTAPIAMEYVLHEADALKKAGYNPFQLIQKAQMVRAPDPLIPQFLALAFPS